MNQMHYRGYTAQVEYDAEDRILVGRLADIADIAVFHGASVDELETAFHETVDHYLAVSARTGIPAQVPAQPPAAADLTLRLPPEVYAAVVSAASGAGTGIDQWAAARLAEAARRLAA